MGPIKGAKKYPPPKCRRVLDNVAGRSVPGLQLQKREVGVTVRPRLAHVPSLSPLAIGDPVWMLLFDASTPFPSRSCVKEICNHSIQKFHCESFFVRVPQDRRLGAARPSSTRRRMVSDRVHRLIIELNRTSTSAQWL
jgi:hypothetical protein